MSENPTPEASGPFSDFVLVNDPNEADSLVRECLRTTAPALIWAQGQALRIKVPFHHRPGPQNTFSVTAGENVDVKAFSAELVALKTSQVFFSASLSKANILFRTNYLGFEDRLLKFEIPKKIYKVQRRKDMRFMVRDGYLIKISFKVGGLDLVKKIYDISAGGVSFLIEPSEESLFATGSKIEGMKFEILNKEVVAHGEIRHNRAVRNKEAYKVGLIFTHIDEADASLINKYVFDENIRFMSRYM